MKDAEAIREKVRQAEGLRGLAKRSGVSLSTIMRIRNHGDHNPSVGTLEALERHFNESKKRGKK